ncbi:outer membrane protein [Erythrobacter colymbi]|uniref:outer membrane protein n=1 Tax=Erythrobacter colymbi TaxID=1161202 RepID=UPI000A3614E0|nr:porin family protein [Erythrobacter colymbi]
MKVISIALAASALAVATPAFAQEESTAGGKFVAGAIIGVDRVEFEVDGFTSRDEDAVFGITAGYDYETEKGLVFGIEAEYTDSSLGVSVQDGAESASVNAGRDLYVGGRLGFRPGKNGLLYVKGGYTNASIELEYDDGTGQVSAEESFDGFRLGAGGEIDLGKNYGIRLEYRYSDYGSLGLGDLLGTDFNVSRHQGVVTLLGKF